MSVVVFDLGLINLLRLMAVIIESTCVPLLRSSDVTLPWSMMWLADISVRMSQKRIRLSKCPEMMVEPAPSEVTRSLQDDPANLVSVPEDENTIKNF